MLALRSAAGLLACYLLIQQCICLVTSPGRQQRNEGNLLTHRNGLSRREVLGTVASSTLISSYLSSIQPLPAVAEDLMKVTDTKGAYSFQVPPGWEKSEAAISGGRTVTVFAAPGRPAANAFVAATPLRGDYTSLGSFGNLDYVESTVVPKGPGIESRCLESRSQRGTYFYDYTVKQEGRPEKRLKTIFAVVPDEFSPVLVTFTAQCDVADYEEYGTLLSAIASSFELNKK